MSKKITSQQMEKEQFIFHIDTDVAEITLQDFINISKSLEITCKSVSSLLFDDKSCQIVIEAPENGSFKLVYKIIVVGGLVLSPMAADTVNGVLEEYTGHDWKYYSGKTARAVTDFVVGAYTATSDTLKRTIHKLPDAKKDKFEKIVKAQNDFYTTMSKNKAFNGVGFTNEDIFPVLRKDFTYHTSVDIERPLPTVNVLKRLVIYRSLNVDEDGKWEFRDTADGTHFSATIEDMSFKQKFLNGGTPLKRTKKDDEIVALVEYDKKMKNGSEDSPVITVKEIYSFNDKKIKEAPANLIMNLIKPKDTRQGDLFDD